MCIFTHLNIKYTHNFECEWKSKFMYFFFQILFFFLSLNKGLLSPVLARKGTMSQDIQSKLPAARLDGEDEHVPILFSFKEI